jgi:hypothetical protein
MHDSSDAMAQLQRVNLGLIWRVRDSSAGFSRQG